jgi:hypothetical protein
MTNQQEDTVATGLSTYTHDEKGKRADVHRPSAINPGDYEYKSVTFARKHPVKGGPAGTCHHCGKAIVWEVNYLHKPSDKMVTFGYICAGILDLTDNRIDHEMVLLKRAAENEKWQYMRELEHADRRKQFDAEFPELAEFFQEHDFDVEENYFIRSMKESYDKWGSLLPRQTDALKSALQKRAEYYARRLAEPIPTVLLDDHDGQRHTLTGIIVSEKYVAADNHPIKAHKMLVRLDDANKVYGSVPVEIERAVEELERESAVGLRISFDATVKVSKNDDHFGFFNRPTKAKVIT